MIYKEKCPQGKESLCADFSAGYSVTGALLADCF